MLIWESIFLISFTILLPVFIRHAEKTHRTGAQFLKEIAPPVWAWTVIIFLNVLFFNLMFAGVLPVDALESLVFLKPADILRFWIYSISASALVTCPLFFVPQSVRKWAAVFLVCALGLLVFADALYMRYFRWIIGFWTLLEINQIAEITESIRALLDSSDAYMLVVVLAVVLFAIFFRFPISSQRVFNSVPGSWRLVFLSICFLVTLPVLYSMGFYASKLAQAPGRPVVALGRVLFTKGIVYGHFVGLLEVMYEWKTHFNITPERLQEVVRYFDMRSKKTDMLDEYDGIARGKNVIFIQVESLNYWTLGYSLNDHAVTPFLNHLADQSLTSPYFFDQTAGGSSSDADYIVLNSLYPLLRGALSKRCPQNSFVALPQILSDEGYTTFSASSAPPSVWHKKLLHQKYGFSRVQIGDDWLKEEAPGTHISDGVYLERVLDEISVLARPFFAHVITRSSHFPYRWPPENAQSFDAGQYEGTSLGDYLKVIHYMDTTLEAFFQGLENKGILKDSVVFLFSDHRARLPRGKAHLELAGLPDYSPFSYLMMKRIPLFVVAPGLDLRGTISKVGGQIDVSPTLLHLLGIARPRSFLGRSLFSSTKSLTCIPSWWGAAISGDRMFVSGTGVEPPGGICFEFPSGNKVSTEDCQDISDLAYQELEMSQQVALNNLAREITKTVYRSSFGPEE